MSLVDVFCSRCTPKYFVFFYLGVLICCLLSTLLSFVIWLLMFYVDVVVFCCLLSFFVVFCCCIVLIFFVFLYFLCCCWCCRRACSRARTYVQSGAFGTDAYRGGVRRGKVELAQSHGGALDHRWMHSVIAVIVLCCFLFVLVLRLFCSVTTANNDRPMERKRYIDAKRFFPTGPARRSFRVGL